MLLAPHHQVRRSHRSIHCWHGHAAAPYRASGLVHWHFSDMCPSGLVPIVCSIRTSEIFHGASGSPLVRFPLWPVVCALRARNFVEGAALDFSFALSGTNADRGAHTAMQGPIPWPG